MAGSSSGLRTARVLTAALALFAAGPASAQAPARPGADAVTALAPGAGSFTFRDWAGTPLRVFYYVPEKVRADTRILFVMHGMGRNADGYRNDWLPFARDGNFILVTPEYSKADFPNAETYNLGHMTDAAGRRRPRATWSFSAIEPLFDHVRKATGSRVPDYAIYGHSAGAQFLHRFLNFVPDARFSHMIVANAGWYTMLDRRTAFPYGLKGTPVTRARLASALGKKVTVLLGTADIDPNHHQLSRTPGAMAQGPHRMARGQSFHAHAQATAAALRTPFNWRLAYAPGIAHSNKGMSAAAAPLVWR